MTHKENKEKPLEHELQEVLAEYARQLLLVYEEIEADPEKMRRFRELTGRTDASTMEGIDGDKNDAV